MSDLQLIPATIAGFELIEFGFADHDSPVLMLRREPVVAWQLTAAGTLRPLTASTKPFDLDGDENVVIGHPNGAMVSRGVPYANAIDYMAHRRAQLRREAVVRARQGLQAAAVALSKLAGRDAAVAVLERFRAPGFTGPIVKVHDVPEAKLAELSAVLAAELSRGRKVTP